MAKDIISPEEGEELNQLRQQHLAATVNAAAVAAQHGMDSPQFREADAATGRIAHRIKEILRTDGTRRMAT